MVKEARSQYFPTVTFGPAINVGRQSQNLGSKNSSTTTTTTGSGGTITTPTTTTTGTIGDFTLPK